MTARVRVRGVWPWFGALFCALWRVHPRLAWLAAWPLCRFVVAYWIDGERV